MKNVRSGARTEEMNADAYAGFLKLLLTPASRIPAPSADIDEYLRYVNRRSPISAETRRVIGHQRDQAA